MFLSCGVGEDSWKSLGRRSNQSILKEISPEYSLKGLMLKLKLQYFGHLMQRADSLEKTLTLSKIEGKRKRGQEDEMVGWHHQLNGHAFEQALGVGDGQGSLVSCSPQGHKEWDMTKRLNWTGWKDLGVSGDKGQVEIFLKGGHIFSETVNFD